MVSGKPDADHFNQKPRRKAAFVKPLNALRDKIGYGGLNEERLDKAESVLENNAIDFVPMADRYLTDLMGGENGEALIAGLLSPAMELKSNGGMFGYPLVTRLADRLIHFLEVIVAPDKDALDVVQAFHTTMRSVLTCRITGSRGQYGDALIQPLDASCRDYFARYPDSPDGEDHER